MKTTVRISIAVLAFSLVAATPAMAAETITVEGGGWGHGIGMSQYGAKALAGVGKTAAQITSHFYPGTQIGTVGTGNLVGHADPLRIGAAQSQVRIDFSALGGPITLCLGADCTFVAQPGDGLAWSLRADGAGNCQYYNAETPVGTPGACDGEWTWANQPNVLVSVSTLNRVYGRGKVVFVPAPGNTFHLLVELGLEEYLYGLGEMPSSWPTEALKAQAIAGRTYALYKAWIWRDLANKAARMDACACHLYASTKDQKYIGWAKEGEVASGTNWGAIWKAAVDATAGQALIHSHSGGRAIESYFFSSSGGATENNEDIWGGSPYPYLRSVTDPGPTYWTKDFDKSTFAALLGFDLVFSAEITATYDSGSPSSVVVKGLVGDQAESEVFTGKELDAMLGLRSHYVTSITGFLPASFAEFVAGDFDNDGRDEVAAFSTNDGTWWVFDAEGSSMVGSLFADVSASGWREVRGGDFNGDGKDDVAMFNKSGDWWVGVSNGSTFQFSEWANFSTSSGWRSQMVGDFNGDGKDDIANFHPGNGTWWVSRSTGSGFSTRLWADFSTASGWQSQIAGDFNGDGKDDIANFHPSNGTWWVSRSTGSGFSTRLWADYTTASGWSPQLVGDFNDDGKDDIANFHSSNGTWWVSRSNGSSFSTYLEGSVAPPSGWKGQLAGDYDGDGDDDLSNFRPSTQTWTIS